MRSGRRNGRPDGPDSIVKNTASSFVAQMTTASLTALLTLFLVRALGARQYGLFAVAVGMSSIAIAFADLGISSSTARFVAEHRASDAKLRTLIADALKLKVIVTGLVCALLAALASVIASAYGTPAIVWPLRAIALATFGQSTYLMLLGVSTALGRAIVNVRLVAVESVLEITASVGLVLAGAGATGAAFGRAVGYILGAIVAAGVVLRMRGHAPVGRWRLPRRSIVRLVGRYAGPVFAIDASFTLSSSLSVLFLGAYVGSAASGIYQAPLKLITLIQYVGLSTAAGVAPRLSRGPGQEPNVRALNGALRGLIGFQCLLLAPAVVWAEPITRVLLGPGYSRSADVLTVLAPYIFFCGLAPLVTIGVSYLGEAARRVPIALATLALAAAGGFILIPSHGVVGAAIATDIAFGFYTLAHIWLCRRLFHLQIGMLVWSLACGLTAAAAMGIVLESIGTTHLTVLDWLRGGIAGIAAYVAMLIFTREIRGAQIAYARAKVGEILTGLARAWRRRQPPAAVTAPPGLTGATTGRGDSSPRAAQPPAVAPAGAAASGGRDEFPIEVPMGGGDEAQVPDRLVADGGAKPARSGRLLRREPRRHVRSERRRERSAAARPDVAPAPSFVATHLARGDRPPAARPPGWVAGQVPQPVDWLEADAAPRSPAAAPPGWVAENFEPAPEPPLGRRDPGRLERADAKLADPERRDFPAPASLGDTREHAGRPWPEIHSDERPLPAAAQPPPWVSTRKSSGRMVESTSAANGAVRPSPEAPAASAQPNDASPPPTEIVYQIAWRLDKAGGVFALRPADHSDRSDAPAVEPSPPVSWGWRVAPLPTPEAKRAHAALIDRLLSEGWQRTGAGETWFADRFRSPAEYPERVRDRQA